MKVQNVHQTQTLIHQKIRNIPAAVILCLFAFQVACDQRSINNSTEKQSELVSRLEKWPVCDTTDCSTRWYRLRILGIEAGTESRQQCRCHTPRGDRIMVQSKGQFAFVRQGTRIEQFAKEKTLMDPSGRFIRYHRTEGQDGQTPRIVEAGKIGKKLVSIRGPEIMRSNWEEQGLAGVLFQHFVWKSHIPKQGQELTCRVFSFRTGKYSDQRLKVIDITGSRHSLVDVKAQDAPGVITTIELDGELDTVRERSRFGKFTIELIALKQKPKSIIPDNLPDITRFMSVHTKGTMTHPESVCAARYKIRNLPSRIALTQFHGPGQKILTSKIDGTIELLTSSSRGSNLAFPLPAIPNQVKLMLEPTALLASDDPRIKKIAIAQTHGAKTAIGAALALRRWVAQNIRSDMGMTFASALEVLHTGRGDCSEKSVLLVALARSVGIPARAVIGLVFSGDGFAGHMWCEVWTGRWVPIDASFGPETVSAARIRLGVDFLQMSQSNVNNTALTEVMTAGVTIVIEDITHWQKDGTCPDIKGTEAATESKPLLRPGPAPVP